MNKNNDLEKFFSEQKAKGIKFVNSFSSPPIGLGLKFAQNPILCAPASTHHICHPQVIFDNKSKLFYMIYLHYDELRPPVARLVIAKSKDGLQWTSCQDKPVFAPSDNGWDNGRTGYHSIVKYGDAFYMYYSGADKKQMAAWGSIGLATSKDLFLWERYKKNPVLVPGKTGFDAGAVIVPCLFIENNTWYMYYIGRSKIPDWHIGLAVSSDGINWKRHENNPVLSPVPDTWESLRISPQNIIKYNGKYYMFYNGYTGKIYSAGIAISDDLITWEKYKDNPIFTVGSDESWETRIVDHQFCMPVKDKYYIWYSGANNVSGHIGLAFLIF